MRRLTQVGLSVAALAVAGLLWVRYFPEAAGLAERAGVATAAVEAPRPGGPGAARGAAPVVIGAPVVAATVNDRVSAIGDGRATRSVTLTPYVSGRIARVDIRSGDYAVSGTPLVELDSEAEEIALDRARLTLDDARATLVRSRGLQQSNAISEVQLRTAELAVSQSELAVRDAALALDRRTVRAPFDGWIGIVNVDVGDQVASTTEIATIDDRAHILVDFRLPERFVGKVRAGTPVTARPLALAGVEMAGKVVTLDSRVSPDTRTLRVQASLDNTEDLLRAGMSFSIGIAFPGDTFAAVDPLAIQWSADGAYVWTGRDGRAAQVPVRIVQRTDDAVLVDGDLPAGTMVVTQGVQVLRSGAPFHFEGEPTGDAPKAPPT